MFQEAMLDSINEWLRIDRGTVVENTKPTRGWQNKDSNERDN
jgi:hypothetical protein